MRNFFKGVRKHIAKLDVGHLREQYELVSDELSHAEKLLNALKEGFIRLDASGAVIQSNPAAKELLGVEPGAALLQLNQIIYDQNGAPLHTSHQVIRGDRFTFRI